ncbi:hypothetical protein HH212_22915 [Massilia forsythiae]|uniref:Uncharacterized protein n=1 Tax=Massilia forsythiae TaxID=2728020 RepID=A0A7Z2ZUF7_9BURK|nr:hypothetical protein [Massilia forsythiae]QJE02518.1 hypothetical protein HH212_22915 [Massilia forsythiae]
MTYIPNPQSSDAEILAMILKEILVQLPANQRATIKQNLSAVAKRMQADGVNSADGRRLNELAQGAGLGSLF